MKKAVANTVAGIVLVFLVASAFWLSGLDGDGRTLAFALVSGALFGIFLQRSRFCFYCNTRDFFATQDARGVVGILLALLVGTIAYHAIFGAFLPVAGHGRLPPDAHVGPVSWVLPIAALVFGIGMTIAGSCVSAQLYRLGEGLLSAPLALLGVLIGFVLGFKTWNVLYLRAMQEAPVLWLPDKLGYGGSLILQVAVLAGLTIWLLRHWPKSDVSEQTLTPMQRVFKVRWPTWVGGVLIGALAGISYLRIGSLGVTAELGSVARTFADARAWLPERLEGLDSFAGCATAVKEALLSNNGVFISALVLGALAVALISGDFKPKLPTLAESSRALVGGVLMGWGGMTALGCTVGTLLSGIMAAAVSGWVFAIFCVLGTYAAWRVRQHYGI